MSQRLRELDPWMKNECLRWIGSSIRPKDTCTFISTLKFRIIETNINSKDFYQFWNYGEIRVVELKMIAGSYYDGILLIFYLMTFASCQRRKKLNDIREIYNVRPRSKSIKQRQVWYACISHKHVSRFMIFSNRTYIYISSATAW